MGNLAFSFELLGDNYRIVLEGEGLKVRGEGFWSRKSFEGRVLFDNFSLQQEKIKVAGVSGAEVVRIGRDFTSFTGSFSGSMTAEGLSSHFQARLDIQSGEGLLGNFDIVFGDVRRGESKLFKRILIRGRTEGERIEGDYTVDELSTGRFVYNVKKEGYSLWGKLSKMDKDYGVLANFELKGWGEDFSAKLKGKVDYGGITIPLEASLERLQDVWRGSLRGFSLKLWAFDVQVEPFVFEAGSVEWKGLSVSLGKNALFKVSSQSINLDLDRRTFNFLGKVEGSAMGYVLVQYEPSQGLMVRMEGSVDMGALSRVVRSKILSTVSGSVNYAYVYGGGKQSLSIHSKDKLLLTSRYLGAELMGWLSLSYDGEMWRGHARFGGNGSELSIFIRGKGQHVRAQLSYRDLSIIYRSDEVRYRGRSSGELTVDTNLEEFHVEGSLAVKGGYLDVFSLPKAKGEKTEAYKSVKLDIRLATQEPMRVRLPEGQVVASLKGGVFGDLRDIKYRIDVDLLEGKLTYFRKDFFVRQGRLELSEEEKKIDLSVSSPTADYNLIMDISGSLDYPKVFLRSDPPKDQRELLSALVSGGPSQGILSIDSVLSAQFPELGKLTQIIGNVIGTDVSVMLAPVIGTTEAGISTRISKDFGEKVSVEYQQSTLRDPKETYVGGSARLTRGTSISGKVYSHRSKEVNLRFQRKFDLR